MSTGTSSAAALQQLVAVSRPLMTTIMIVLILETLLFGAYLILLSVNAYLQLRQHSQARSGRWRSRPAVLTSLAIFCLCAAHWTLTILAFIFAFLNYSGGLGLVGLLVFYFKRLQILEAVRDTLTLLTILVGYFALIYRMWVIWNRDIRVALLPIALWLGQLGCGTAIVILVFRNDGDTVSLLDNPLFTADWILMLSLNVYCTVFTAWKIWRTCRPAGGSRAKMFMAVLAVLLESYAALAAWLVFFIATHQLHSVAELAAVDLSPQVIGIMNVIIQIRVGLQRRSPSPATPMLTRATDREMVLTSVFNSSSMEESKW
ncbi:hypothetical protein C8F01DRAFT_1131061 [Mycena amicta]|nr:hypothetical protein C8F01DRAFT_1131061 [Mycena amicta]